MLTTQTVFVFELPRASALGEKLNSTWLLRIVIPLYAGISGSAIAESRIKRIARRRALRVVVAHFQSVAQISQKFF